MYVYVFIHKYTVHTYILCEHKLWFWMPLIDLTALKHANTHTLFFLNVCIYIYIYFFYISMEYFCISWKTKPHFNFKNSQAALKTRKLTLSASSFKASGLKSRLYHQNNSTRQKTKCTVFESQTDTVWKESSEDAEPKQELRKSISGSMAVTLN